MFLKNHLQQKHTAWSTLGANHIPSLQHPHVHSERWAQCVDVRFRLHGGHCDEVVRDVPTLARGEGFCKVPLRILPEWPSTRQQHHECLWICHISLQRWLTDTTDRFTPLKLHVWLAFSFFPVVHEAKIETRRKHRIENRPDKQQLASLRVEFRLPSTHCEEPDTFLSHVCERDSSFKDQTDFYLWSSAWYWGVHKQLTCWWSWACLPSRSPGRHHGWAHSCIWPPPGCLRSPHRNAYVKQ